MFSWFRRRPSSPLAVSADSDPIQQLMDAVLNDRSSQIQALLDTNKLDVHFRYGRAKRGLCHTAASFGAYQCLRLLAARGCDINQRDVGNLTPIMLAARNGHSATVSLLVKELHADLTATDDVGFTVLHWLASNGRHEPLAMLLKSGLDIHTRDRHQRTLLHVACHAGHHNVVRFLLRNGMDVNGTDEDRRTALHHVCIHNQLTCVEILLAHHAIFGPDSMGMTPMQYSLQNPEPKLLLMLLDYYPAGFKDIWAAARDASVEIAPIVRVLSLWCTQHGPNVIKDVLNTLVDQYGTLVKSSLCHTSGQQIEVAGAQRFASLIEGVVNTLRLDGELAKESLLHHHAASILGRLLETKMVMGSWMDILTAELGEAASATSTDSETAPVAPPIHSVYLERLAGILASFFHLGRLWLVENSEYRLQELSSDTTQDWLGQYLPLFEAWIQEDCRVFLHQFGFIMDCSRLLPHFQNILQTGPVQIRLEWLQEHLPGRLAAAESNGRAQHSPTLTVDRSALLDSSCQRLLRMDALELQRALDITFADEAGQGQGVVREWFNLLSKELFNPDYALFVDSEDGAIIHSGSHVNADHLSYYRFAGRLLALAIIHRITPGIQLSRVLICQMMGLPPSLQDLRLLDPQFVQSTQWLLDHDVEQAGLDLTFAVDVFEYGQQTTVELIPRGASIAVTEVNKAQYVSLLCAHKAGTDIRAQVAALREGWSDIIQPQLQVLISVDEVQALVAGQHQLDVNAWRAHTEYSNFEPTDDVIVWFWELVEGMSEAQRALLLQFATGSSKLPHGGFPALKLLNQCAFTVSRATDMNAAHARAAARAAQVVAPVDPDVHGVPNDPSREPRDGLDGLDGQPLPTASTCFNLLRLPEYSSKAALAKALTLALEYGKDVQLA